MNKKITGVPESKEETRGGVIESRTRFSIYSSHLKDKKEECKLLKKDNEAEREQIKKERRLAEKFKFTNMSKKTPFLPTLK